MSRASRRARRLARLKALAEVVSPMVNLNINEEAVAAFFVGAAIDKVKQVREAVAARLADLGVDDDGKAEPFVTTAEIDRAPSSNVRSILNIIERVDAGTLLRIAATAAKRLG